MSIDQTKPGTKPETNTRALKRYEPFADRLILLRHQDKRPLNRDWPNERNSFADAEDHMKRGFNVGFRLGKGIAVLDYDRARDRMRDDPVQNSLARLCRYTGIDLANAECVETGNGVHVYITIEDGSDHAERHPHYPGVEYKGAGRYVVCAGSRHPSGKVYQWK